MDDRVPPPPPPPPPPTIGMWSNQPPPPPPPMYPAPSWGREPEPSWAQKLKRSLGPIGVVIVVCLKFLAKLKFIILPILKFLPLVLKTGGTMLLSIWLYGMMWGIWFAVG